MLNSSLTGSHVSSLILFVCLFILSIPRLPFKGSTGNIYFKILQIVKFLNYRFPGWKEFFLRNLKYLPAVLFHILFLQRFMPFKSQLFAGKYIISLYSFCRYFPSFLNASFRSPVYIWLYTNYDVYIRYFFIIILDTPWSILKWKPKKFGSDEFLLLFLWYISSLQLLFIFQTHVGWILDVLKWFSSWPFLPPLFSSIFY